MLQPVVAIFSMCGGDRSVSRRSLLRAGGIAVSLGGLSLSQISRDVRGDSEDFWGMFQHDAANTSYNSSTTGPRGNLISNWEFETSKSVYSAPVVTRTHVYATDSDGIIRSIERNNGTGVWRFETNQSTSGGSHVSSPALANETLYVGSLDQRVYALSASDGTRQWTAGTGGGIVSSPTLAGDTVYIGSNDASVYALNAENGRKRWSYPTVGEVSAAPAVVNNTVYIGANASPYQEGNFYALDSQTGSEKWNFEAEGAIAASAVASDEAIYVGDSSGMLYCLNSNNGSEKWSLDTGGAITSTLVSTEQLVCAVAGETVYAVNKQEGAVVWRFSIRLQFYVRYLRLRKHTVCGRQ